MTFDSLMKELNAGAPDSIFSTRAAIGVLRELRHAGQGPAPAQVPAIPPTGRGTRVVRVKGRLWCEADGGVRRFTNQGDSLH